MVYWSFKTRVLLRRYLAFWVDAVAILAIGYLLELWQWNTVEGILATTALLICYRTVCDAYAGRTVGKLIFRIRTIRRNAFELDGVGMWRSVVRNLLVIVDHVLISSVIGLIIPLTSEANRRVGDMAANTMVVSEGSLKQARRYLKEQQAAKERSRSPATEQEQVRRRAGDAAEQVVSSALERLCREGYYYLFNKLREPAVGDIDHLLIGPSGLVIVETKADKGVVRVVEGAALVDNKPFHRDPIQQASRQWEVLLQRVPALCKPLPSWSRFHTGSETAGLSWLACFPNASCILRADDPYDAALTSRLSTAFSLPAKVLSLDEVLRREEIDGLVEGITRVYGVEPDAAPHQRAYERE